MSATEQTNSSLAEVLPLHITHTFAHYVIRKYSFPLFWRSKCLETKYTNQCI